MKSMGKGNIYDSTVQQFFYGVVSRFRGPISLPTLHGLSCLTQAYSRLWETGFPDYELMDLSHMRVHSELGFSRTYREVDLGYPTPQRLRTPLGVG